IVLLEFPGNQVIHIELLQHASAYRHRLECLTYRSQTGRASRYSVIEIGIGIRCVWFPRCPIRGVIRNGTFRPVYVNGGQWNCDALCQVETNHPSDGKCGNCNDPATVTHFENISRPVMTDSAARNIKRVRQMKQCQGRPSTFRCCVKYVITRQSGLPTQTRCTSNCRAAYAPPGRRRAA